MMLAIRMVLYFAAALLAGQGIAVYDPEAARHYGETEFRRLRLDRFGGCFNYRKMRGSNTLSIHSWGAAYDVDPERNGFTTPGPTATLSGAEYVPFWNIVEAHGAHVLGRRSNKDWMHFQFARWA